MDKYEISDTPIPNKVDYWGDIEVRWYGEYNEVHFVRGSEAVAARIHEVRVADSGLLMSWIRGPLGKGSTHV